MPCKKSTTAAMRRKMTPPYSPSQCKGLVRVGNNGKKYRATRTVAGGYRWKLVASTKRKIAGQSTKIRAPHNQKDLIRMRKIIAKNTHIIGNSGCVRMYTSKYVNRPSPPFPAQKCPGLIKHGQDGYMYQSTPNKNGIHRWIRV